MMSTRAEEKNEINILYKEGNLKKYITENNKNGVLWLACVNGHLEMVKYLVEKCGADVRVYNDSIIRITIGLFDVHV